MVFDLFPQQNFCDMLKSTAFQFSAYRGGKNSVIKAIKALENARQWQPPVFAEAIDKVWPGAIWIDRDQVLHVAGGPSTLARIVDTYLVMVGEMPIREVV